MNASLTMDAVLMQLVLTFMVDISVAVMMVTVAMVEPVMVRNKANCIGWNLITQCFLQTLMNVLKKPTLAHLVQFVRTLMVVISVTVQQEIAKVLYSIAYHVLSMFFFTRWMCLS